MDSRLHPPIGFLLCLLAACAVGAAAWAQEKSRDTKNNPQSGSDTRSGKTVRRTVPVALPEFTPQRETAALQFVRDHHRELVELLQVLKEADDRGYHRAIRELSRTYEGLARTKERGDLERFEIDLEMWKVDSRIHLAVARLGMNQGETASAAEAAARDDSLRTEIRRLLLQKNQWRLKRLKLDYVRAKTRLDRLAETIDRLEASGDEMADRAIKQLLNAGKPKPPKKTTKRPRPQESRPQDSRPQDSSDSSSSIDPPSTSFLRAFHDPTVGRRFGVRLS